MNGDKNGSRVGLATSRRNFVAGAALVCTTLSLSLRPTPALARLGPPKGPPPHRGPRGNSCDNPASASNCNCFLGGTRLSTPNGEIAIEKLHIGDLVTTANGQARPVKWLARRRLERQDREAWHNDVRPVRITAGALDGLMPRRDLFLSGAHLIFLEGVLIPAGDLVNGTSIIRDDAEALAVLEYFHVELESHDVLIAEGAAAESLQATSSNREKFDNYDEFVRHHGANAPDLLACAPVMAYRGGRGELASRWRSMIAPVVDVRRPLEVARDRIDNLTVRRAA